MNIITIRETSVNEIFENKELFVEYGIETKSNLVPEVDANIDMYLALESSGMFSCYGCFFGDRLVGFATMMTTVMPHYNKIASTVESVFVMKEYRKYGGGRMLIEYTIDKAKELGSVNFFLSAPIGSSLAKASRLFGLKQTHSVYTRKL